MEKILVKADPRPELGKGSARTLRRAGMLPAVVYSEGSSVPIKVQSKQLTRLIYSGAGEHALITLELSDEKASASELPVLVKEYQRDPVSEELLHIDFIRVSLKKAVVVTVPIEITKMPAGVKEGGILQHRLREIEIECLPTQIPANIEVDAEAITIGQSMHVSDLDEPEGVKIVTGPAEVILSVSAPVVEEVAAEEEAVEGEEPELVKAKGKEEEEAEEKKAEEK